MQRRTIVITIVFMLMVISATAAGDVPRNCGDSIVNDAVIRNMGGMDYVNTPSVSGANLTDAEKKLGTDLLQLLDNDFPPQGMNRADLEDVMERMGQFRPVEGLVYVNIQLEPPAGTQTIEPYARVITDRDEENHLAVAWVALKDLERLASLAVVQTIQTVIPLRTHMDSAMIGWDRVHRPSNMRATYGDSGSDATVETIRNTDKPDRFVNDRFDGRDMAYKRVDGSGIASLMPKAAASEYAFTYSTAAGDLDGDGGDDMLVFNGTYNSITGIYTFEYVSVMGGDGTELWSQSSVYNAYRIYDIPASLAYDLDGDGMSDVVVHSESYDSTTDEYTASVYTMRGYDGHIFWSQSITGDGYYGAYLWTFSWYDLDGDGMNDVVVNAGSYDSITGEYTAGVYARRGYDGHVFWSQSATNDYAYMSGSPCYDLDGDGMDDVIVESESYDSTTGEYTASGHARRGYDGHSFWSQSITGDGYCGAYLWTYSYYDLNGDGMNDVVVNAGSYDSTTDEYTASVYVMRGYDGHVFWSQSATGDGDGGAYLYASSYYDLNDDGMNDVIVNSGSYDSTTDEYTASGHARRGYDGHSFWSQSITGDGYCGAYLWTYSYYDLNGDGMNDVVVNAGSYDSTTDEYTASVYVMRGYDGHVFWSQSATGDGDGGAYLYASSCYDLNGDGRSDVIVNSGSYDSTTDEYTASVDVRRGYDGHIFWGQSITGDGSSGAYVSASSCYDLNGDGRSDVIVNSGSYDSTTDEYTASVYVMRGYDGHVFWSQSATGDGDGGAYLYASSCYDLNGDGRSDVIVNSGSYDSTTDEYTASVDVRRGYDGHIFWGQSITGDGSSGAYVSASSCYDLNGDGRSDVIVNSGSYDSTTDEYTASVDVRRGYDGHIFWSHSVTGDYAYVSASSCYDLNDDGRSDVIVRSESYDLITDEYTASVDAMQGYGGHIFWSQSVTGDGYYGAYLWTYSHYDLNDDGMNDVIVESESYDSTTDEYTASVDVRRGYDGNLFWSQSITGEDVWMETSYCYWDFDGDDLCDVLVTTGVYVDYTMVPTRVCAVKGSDGTSFWCKPSSTPPGPSGDDTVSIDDVVISSLGATQDVPIRLLGSTGVAGVAVTLTFDPSIVDVTSAVAGDFDSIFTPDYVDVSNGILRITCMKSRTDLTGDQIIATVTLEAVGTSGSCELGLSAELTDKSGGSVPSSMDNGVLTISDRTPGDATGDGAINIGDAVLLFNWVSFPNERGATYVLNNPENANVNGDTVTNIGDAVLLFNWVSFPNERGTTYVLH